MASEFRFHHTATGATLYVVLSRGTDGQVYNGGGYEVPLTANWGTYDIALTEQSTTRFYYGDMPAAQAAGLYDYYVFLQAGGGPAVTDNLIGQGRLDWSSAADSGVGAGVTVAAAGLDSVVVETGLNARQALSIAASACAGVLAGATTPNVTIAAAGVPATNRIAATVDGNGNRTVVTLSPPP